ncbi:MAG TPA: MFS transporter [Acetobacteraceae bacterium]
MTDTTTAHAHAAHDHHHDQGVGLSAGMTLLLATACGVIVSCLYFAQPLIQLIGPELGFPAWTGGFIVTLTQLGYGAGLLLVTPLADVLENRRLVLVALSCNVVALALAAVSPTATIFLLASLLVGLTAVVVQILVPLAAHLAPRAIRGRVVGNVMSGLLLGILLGRPAASAVAEAFGWRWVFAASAVGTTVLGLVLARALPVRRPSAAHGYGELLSSLWTVWRTMPEVRRRAFYQAALFGTFSLFWTAVPLLLAQRYGFGQTGIGLFALAGAGGAAAAPIAGRLADHGWARAATGFGMAAVLVAFASTGFDLGLIPLALAAVILDAGVQTNLVVSQRAFYSLAPEIRSRLNSVFFAVFFVGGAIGSTLASVLFAHSWGAVAALGMALPAITLVAFLLERR